MGLLGRGQHDLLEVLSTLITYEAVSELQPDLSIVGMPTAGFRITQLLQQISQDIYQSKADASCTYSRTEMPSPSSSMVPDGADISD